MNQCIYLGTHTAREYQYTGCGIYIYTESDITPPDFFPSIKHCCKIGNGKCMCTSVLEGVWYTSTKHLGSY